MTGARARLDDVIEVSWRSIEFSAVEHLQWSTGVEHRATSSVRSPTGALRYEVVAGRDWVFRILQLESTEGMLAMESDGEGGWMVDGMPRLDLSECVDIDLQFTPFTNSLPIGRLAPGIGESAEITVAYVAYPSLEITPELQRYTRLSDTSYRFESGDFTRDITDFTRDITVDENGLVADYPGLFERL